MLERIRRAIRELDHHELRQLRSELNEADVNALVADWSPGLPWATKDAYIELLQGRATCNGDQLAAMMEDGLNSPTPETRAYAMSFLTGDTESFVDAGWVRTDRVDSAIAGYRARRGTRPASESEPYQSGKPLAEHTIGVWSK